MRLVGLRFILVLVINLDFLLPLISFQNLLHMHFRRFRFLLLISFRNRLRSFLHYHFEEFLFVEKFLFAMESLFVVKSLFAVEFHSVYLFYRCLSLIQFGSHLCIIQLPIFFHLFSVLLWYLNLSFFPSFLPYFNLSFLLQPCLILYLMVFVFKVLAMSIGSPLLLPFITSLSLIQVSLFRQALIF